MTAHTLVNSAFCGHSIYKDTANRVIHILFNPLHYNKMSFVHDLLFITSTPEFVFKIYKNSETNALEFQNNSPNVAWY